MAQTLNWPQALRPDGLSTCPALTTPLPTELVDILPNQMPSPDALTTKSMGKTTKIRSCSLRNNSPPKPCGTSDECLKTETNTESFHIHIKTKSSEIVDWVHSCTNWDESVICTLKELGSGANLQGDEWEECDGLILFRGKVYVPLDAQLQHDIVGAHHNTLVTGHARQWKTTKLVECNYWWPDITSLSM